MGQKRAQNAFDKGTGEACRSLCSHSALWAHGGIGISKAPLCQADLKPAEIP